MSLLAVVSGWTPILLGLLTLLAAYNKYTAAGVVAAEWVSSKDIPVTTADEGGVLGFLSQSPHLFLYSLLSSSIVVRALFLAALVGNARRLFDATKLARGPSLTHWAGMILAHRGYRSEAQQNGTLVPKAISAVAVGASRPTSRRESRAGGGGAPTPPSSITPSLSRRASRDETLMNPLVSASAAAATATLLEKTVGSTPRASDGTPLPFASRRTGSIGGGSSSSPAPVENMGNYNIPENSMLAFIFAHEQGTHGVEVDVALTKDGHILVMHDNTLDRTMEGSGEVPHLTLEQIHQIKYKNVTNQEYVIKDPRNKLVDIVHVPTLETVILFCRERGLKLMIETKEYTDAALLRTKIHALYEKYDMYSWSFVATFNPLHLYYYRRHHPKIPTCLLYCRTCTEWYHQDDSKEMLLPSFLNYEPVRRAFDWVLWLFSPTLVADWLGVSMVGPHNILISPALITSLTTRGIVCDVWVVNSELEKQWLLSLGCIVTSDRLFSKKDVSPFAAVAAAGAAEEEALAVPSIHDAASHVSSSYYINNPALLTPPVLATEVEDGIDGNSFTPEDSPSQEGAGQTEAAGASSASSGVHIGLGSLDVRADLPSSLPSASPPHGHGHGPILDDEAVAADAIEESVEVEAAPAAEAGVEAAAD